jgi:serine/threonine protein phosphatase 1
MKPWSRSPQLVEKASSLSPGERLYAVGDIHGRLDLFIELLELVADDNAARQAAVTTIVILGDVIDRGPDSETLVRQMMHYTAASPRWIVLKGNHEASMVHALRGEPGVMSAWLTYGGDATLRSWGLHEDLIASGAISHIIHEARQAIGPDVLRWMDQLPLAHVQGDYIFVHAGLRPGVSLKQQKEADLLWIGEEFLRNETPFPLVVVHGHHVEDTGPTLTPHRIGLDTGAYMSGRLTALGLEGDLRWTLTTGDAR